MKKPTLTDRMMGFFLAIVALVSPQHSNAQVVSVPKIEITKVGAYNGKYMTVYYGIGNRAAIATAIDQITLREVKLKKTVRIEGNSVTLPAVDLSRSGIYLAYNLVVIVVHPDATFTWKNANGSVPEGEHNTTSHFALAVDSLTKTEIDRMGALQEGTRFEFRSKIQMLAPDF